MFVPAMLVVSVLSLLLFGVVGFEALLDPLPFERATLLRHAMLGAGACLTAVLSQVWFAVYLLGTGRALRKQAGAVAAPPPPWLIAAQRACRRVLPWTLLTPLAALLVFLMGGGVFAGLFGKGAHGVSFGIALGVQLGGLWVEIGGLRAHEAAFRQADQSPDSRGNP